MKDSPEIEIILLSNGDAPRGVGKSPIESIGAATAVFAPTGKRLNRMPLEFS